VAARNIDPRLECVRVEVDATNPNDWWTSVAGIACDGVLLVRPDQHIAFRSLGAAVDPTLTLRRAVDVTLGRETPPRA
jgi:2,4-dichlorophenol 6-monooxygenase